jgi:parallel beta-helix repeat protein
MALSLLASRIENWGNRIHQSNHAEGTGDNGISITGYRNTVTGNICNGNYHTGIYVYGNSNTVTGNVCLNNNQRFLVDGSQSFGGILVTPSFGGSGYDNTITGNVCIDDQATPTQAYGVRFTPPSYFAVGSR